MGKETIALAKQISPHGLEHLQKRKTPNISPLRGNAIDLALNALNGACSGLSHACLGQVRGAYVFFNLSSHYEFGLAARQRCYLCIHTKPRTGMSVHKFWWESIAPWSSFCDLGGCICDDLRWMIPSIDPVGETTRIQTLVQKTMWEAI